MAETVWCDSPKGNLVSLFRERRSKDGRQCSRAVGSLHRQAVLYIISACHAPCHYQCSVEYVHQLGLRVGSAVGQDALEMIPYAFIGIQFRGVGGERHPMKAGRS